MEDNSKKCRLCGKSIAGNQNTVDPLKTVNEDLRDNSRTSDRQGAPDSDSTASTHHGSGEITGLKIVSSVDATEFVKKENYIRFIERKGYCRTCTLEAINGDLSAINEKKKIKKRKFIAIAITLIVIVSVSNFFLKDGWVAWWGGVVISIFLINRAVQIKYWS